MPLNIAMKKRLNIKWKSQENKFTKKTSAAIPERKGNKETIESVANKFHFKQIDDHLPLTWISQPSDFKWFCYKRQSGLGRLKHDLNHD